MVELHDVPRLLQFLERDPIRYRALIHDLSPVMPVWYDTLRQEHGENETTDRYYVDSWIHIGCVLRIRAYPQPGVRGLWAEGVLGSSFAGRITPQELIHWCQKLDPAHMATTHQLLRDCLTTALGIAHDDWIETRHHVVSTREALSLSRGANARRLTQADRPRWRGFFDRHQGQGPMMGVLAHMYGQQCAELPAAVYGAFDGRGPLVGALATAQLTRHCDEVIACCIPSASEAELLLPVLLAAAAQDTLAAGRALVYACDDETVSGWLSAAGLLPVHRTWRWTRDRT